MDNSKLHDMIDACRPGSEDLAAPELRDAAEAIRATPLLAQQWERSNRLDAALAKATRDVPVPAGLADRLLAKARLVEGSPAVCKLDSTVAAAAQSAPNIVDDAPTAARSRGIPRRRWLKAVVQGAVSVAVAGAAVRAAMWLKTPTSITREGLSNQASTWVIGLSGQWETAADASLTTSHPPATALMATPRAWQKVSTTLDSQAVVYDLSSKRGRAMLFVLRTRAGAPLSTEPSRLPSTGGWGMAAWKVGDSLYVLVLDEARLRLDEFVRQPRAVAQSNFSSSWLL